MIKISVKNISITLLFSFLFFFCISCGGGSGTIEPVPISSTEFQKFVSEARQKSYEEFCQWWNTSEYKNWKWANYQGSGYPVTEGQIILSWPDNSTAEEIWKSKLINCHRATILLQAVYDGEAVYLAQQEKNWSHEVLLLHDEIYSYFSNSGLTFEYRKLLAGSRDDAIKELNGIFKK